ncbi:hypothetical protein V6N13_115786 [Hibiscus sabdariffa]
MYGESVLLQSTVIVFSRLRSNKPGQLVLGFVRNGWSGGVVLSLGNLSTFPLPSSSRSPPNHPLRPMSGTGVTDGGASWLDTEDRHEEP